MALPTPTPTGTIAIPNGNFELGNVNWTSEGIAVIVNSSQLEGNWCVRTEGANEFPDGFIVTQDMYAVVPGQPITVSAIGQITQGTAGTFTRIDLRWYDGNGNIVNTTTGPEQSYRNNGTNVHTVTISTSVPAGVAYVRVVGVMNVSLVSTPSILYMDNFSWNYTTSGNAEARLVSPTIQTYTSETPIPYRIETTLRSGTTVTSVSYYYQTFNSSTSQYENEQLVATVTEAPYGFNAPAMPEGQYAAYARVTLSNGLVLVTNNILFTVGEVTVVTREYKASNAYTYLVGENILNLGSGLPPTAVVTGIEFEVNNRRDILARVRDSGVTDISQYTSTTPFDIINDGVFEFAAMSKSNGQYTVVGSPMTLNVPINETDYTLSETGIADAVYKWVVWTRGYTTDTVGAEDELFNLGSVPASDFLNYSFGVRFYPTVNAKPAYAADGDACVRVKLDTFKIRVYFDAGSVVYYFASPDRSQIIKATLVAYNVTSGNFKNGDASGVLQLSPELEIISGTQSWIGDDWTIHSGEPTDSNLIGYVSEREEDDGVGMSYNGLPTQQQVYNNRSRYVFITANFYGDINLESMYGANGYDRGFAYNGKDFYKIQTQPDIEKDKPRHVAFHHSHLALGYMDGRVDISVVGEPYNFNGVDGASSWAIGDSVTGLLPLAGSILGVFCKKSVVGISGTTVDNFATQTLSPALGAVEYTIADMGYPVYANAYGVYTLSQTQEYGDYLGTPMSQAISPWLRPRLVRKYTSDKEVVVAWPVRSKNQYKLAFSDGYVMSMTMNYGQQSAPTFSKQKYFVTDADVDYGDISLYEYPSIYPMAVSSQLDDGGEERIHVANLVPPEPVPPAPPTEFIDVLVNEAQWYEGAVSGTLLDVPPAYYEYIDPTVSTVRLNGTEARNVPNISDKTITKVRILGSVSYTPIVGEQPVPSLSVSTWNGGSVTIQASETSPGNYEFTGEYALDPSEYIVVDNGLFITVAVAVPDSSGMSPIVFNITEVKLGVQ